MRLCFSGWRIRAGALLAGLVLAATVAAAGADAGASRAALERWFVTLRSTHDLATPQRWQYSFAAADGRALEALSVALVRNGYEIRKLEAVAGPTLLMTKTELHTPMTLAQRNQALLQIAREHHARYIGVDVPRAD